MMKLLLTAFLLAASARADHARPRPGVRAWLEVEGSWLKRMDPGAPALWTIGFTDARTGPVKDFQIVHEKPLHLIVVSRDLSRFAHVHPELDAATGRFKLRLNSGAGPDDRPSAEGLKPGPYLMYAEAFSAALGSLGGRFAARVRGPYRPEPLIADEPSPSGWIEKTGAAVKVEPMPDMLHLSFRLDDSQGLEPWLGMDGHGILIAEGGKDFYHLHAMTKDLTFMLHDEVPPPGLYKLWIQVKRRGEVLTFPFTLRLTE